MRDRFRAFSCFPPQVLPQRSSPLSPSLRAVPTDGASGMFGRAIRSNEAGRESPASGTGANSLANKLAVKLLSDFEFIVEQLLY